MNHQIIDDFLPEADFHVLRDFLVNSAIFRAMPFTCRYGQKDLDDFSLQANLLWFPSIIEPLLTALKAREVLICRANVIMRRNENVVGGFHQDFENRPDITTSVLYINDCNGGTAFKNGGFVQSKANRAVIFNTEDHAGVWQTDTSYRYVVNTNFLQEESYG